jgi:hypothetical protein
MKQRNFSETNKVQKRIRASLVYTDWVERNLGLACIMCDSTKNLHVHHVTDLYYIVICLWKLYGDWDAVFDHSTARHQADLVDNVTVCRKCHKKLHPAKHTVNEATPEQIALWSVLPRHLGVKFKQGTKARHDGSIGLVPLQTMVGFGWYIMNEGVKDRIIEFDRRKFAKLLGKAPGTSFNKSLANSMHALVANNIVIAFMRTDNQYEVHLSPDYLKRIDKCPWFFPLEEATTKRMLVLTLRIFLSYQSIREVYRIGRKKLAGHLGVQTATASFIDKAALKAVEEIGWVDLTIQDNIYCFKIKRRGAVPIHSLRAIIGDSL